MELLPVPFEIRRLIYTELLGSESHTFFQRFDREERPFALAHGSPLLGLHPAILGVNKSTNAEAAAILYSQNRFRLFYAPYDFAKCPDLEPFFQQIGAANAGFLRHLCLQMVALVQEINVDNGWKLALLSDDEETAEVILGYCPGLEAHQKYGGVANIANVRLVLLETKLAFHASATPAMPPKPKVAVKASLDSKEQQPPSTVAERTQQRFHATNPLAARVQSSGLASLTPAEKKTFVYSQLLQPVAQQRIPLGNKSEREFWKAVAKDALPIRRLRDDYAWGCDKAGRDVGTYSLAEHEARTVKQARLTALRLLSQQFGTKRALAKHNGRATEVTEEEIEAETTRRREMASLNRELYGEISGALASDPEWDDVVPIVHEEPEDAVARIAYPDDYAEAVAYLRAVMAAKEYSPRTLRLTALVIALNPAHYTVWLYRFQIVKALELPIPSEITWLNEVALDNLKNYQIWHHRQLLLDHYVPLIFSDDAAMTALARSESAFLATMLAEDTKNYHVWSYRQYMVRKLGHWGPPELGATQSLIEEDVRNNSAWSHRFFLVFQNPDASTPGCGPVEHDAKVPAATITREINYAKEKLALAPQNQSPWNYLRAVLAKAGRKLESEEALAEGFVSGVGTEEESVKSSHALDYLADVYAEQGDKDRARLCLQRLWEKWDPIREGYWKYRAQQLV